MERHVDSSRHPAVFGSLAILVVLSSMSLLFVSLVLVPHDTPGLGAVGRDLRSWCFGASAADTAPPVGLLALWLALPGLVMATVVLRRREALMELLRARPQVVLQAAATMALLTGATGGVLTVALAPPVEQAMPEGLRIDRALADFTLVDQLGRPLRLSELRGEVVLVTAIYSRCTQACPMVFAGLREVMAELPEDQARRLRILAVTLDPEHDDPKRLAALGAAHRLPELTLLTGEPALVRQSLDELGFEYRGDPSTGLIDHPSLFVLVDRRGRLAHRFSNDERSRRWLRNAVARLLAEPSPSSPATTSRTPAAASPIPFRHGPRSGQGRP
ncbi:MAG: SCO family protein [Acidobacteriota bacterium]